MEGQGHTDKHSNTTTSDTHTHTPDTTHRTSSRSFVGASSSTAVVGGLPREILLRVFDCLDLEDVLHVRLVCKQWSAWVICNCIWKKFARRLLQYWYDWSQDLAPLEINLFYDTIELLKKMKSTAGREIKEQDMFLPRENIRKVMKSILPSSTKISREALECVQECATEFVLFVLGEAAEIATKKKRKTVTGQNAVEALKALGLDNYSKLIQIYLEKYKQCGPIRDRSKEKSSDKR